MRNLEQSHGSPKFAIKIYNTPTVVEGKEEKFGSICDIIGLWEGMEGKEGDKVESAGEGGRRKRLSKGIHELTGRFEEEGGNYDSQSEVRCGEGREDLGGLSFMSRISKLSGLEARKSDKVSVDNTKSTFSKIANQFKS